MDPQIEKFLNEFVGKSLNGSGFAIYSPQEKDVFRGKLLAYFSDLIFDTLLRRLSDEQVEELNAMPDVSSEEAQQKIALMTASVPGFIFILQDRFEQEAQEIGRTGRIPEPRQNPS